MKSFKKRFSIGIGLIGISTFSFALPNQPQSNYEKKLFNKQGYSSLTCEKGLNRIEKKLDNYTEVACQDAEGKLQGIAIRLDPKRVKVRAHVYRDNQITDEHTVEWDELGKISYTEEPNLRTTWYNFKKQKKHIETTLLKNRKETREWYQNGKLQTLSIEQEGFPTQVMGWDENGNKLGD